MYLFFFFTFHIIRVISRARRGNIVLVHNIITEDTPKAERHKVEVAENGPKLKKYHKLMGLFKPGGKFRLY